MMNFRLMKAMNKIALIAMLSLLIGCGGARYVEQNNISDVYNNKSTSVHPHFFVYNASSEYSQLYFTLNTDELLYTRNGKNTPFTATVLIKYEVYSSLDNRLLVDSATQKLIDINDELETKELVGSIDMKVPNGANYIIKVTTTDLNRKQETQAFIDLNKSSVNSRQNFMIKDAANGKPVFSRHFDGNRLLIIECGNSVTQLYGRYYNRDFKLAAPPHSLGVSQTFSYEADSLFELKVVDGSANLVLPSQGFVHLQVDTSDKEGLTLFRFSNGYPNVETYEAMLLPMRYITQKIEYETMEEAPDVKKALDNFWLDIANSNEDRAKELISNYYNRVSDANESFTSFMEGWKTDRGLIYIIYGAPNVLYRNDQSETWVYGEETNIMSITFTFNKVSNPFSDNDFELARNELYRSSYYRAVDAWRQGKVYSTN